MKQTDQNRLSMWKTVRHFLDQHQAVWSGSKPFTHAYKALAAAIVAADTALQSQAVSSTGLTLDKEFLEEAVLDKVIAIIRCTKAYAMDAEDNNLHQAVKYSKSDLLRLPQNEMVQTLRAIVEAAAGHKTALKDYGVPAAAYAAAESAIRAYELALPMPRAAIAARGAVTGSIPATMKAGATALTKMDHLTHIYNQPQFAAGFAAARTVVESGGRHEKSASLAKS